MRFTGFRGLTGFAGFPRFPGFPQFQRFSAHPGVLRFATPIAAAVVALQLIVPIRAQPTRNFVWKATGKQGLIYLVGSIHLLTKDFYPLSPALDAAFKDSDLLVEEADLGEMQSPASQMMLLSHGLLPANQSLDKVVSPETYTLVTKRV